MFFIDERRAKLHYQSMVNAYLYTGPRKLAQKSLYLVESWAASLRKSIHHLTRPSEASRRFSYEGKPKIRVREIRSSRPLDHGIQLFFLFPILSPPSFYLLPSLSLFIHPPIFIRGRNFFYSILHLSLVNDIFME